MVVTYEFDAETEAEVVLDIAADKRFIIWDADCPDAAENSAYALINSLAPEAKLVNCYVVDNKAIAQLNDNLAAAVEVITGLVGQDEDVADEIDEIAGDIALIASNVEALFETETLVANDEDIKWLIEEAQNDIDALLAECYQDDLVKKISDVKTTWNLEYAQLETTGQLTDDQKALFDDIYDQIYALADQIEDTDDYTAKTWAEDDAKVANLALFFSDFSQYIKDNYILGDANLNFDVTVSDAVLAVSFVLETATPNERQQYTADVNQDGEISVTDAVSIVDIALGFEPVAAGVKAMAPVASEDYLVLDGAEISLFNEKSYRGFQMDIMAEDGAAIDVELGTRAAGLQIFKNKLADGSTRIVALSLTGGSIEAQEGLLLTVKGSSKFTVSNVEFTGTDMVAYALKVQSATGISGIKAGYEGESIYTIGGARLNKIQKSGVYVVNGKKVLVK